MVSAGSRRVGNEIAPIELQVIGASLRSIAEEHGHLREVIVQNFRAKADTRMSDHPDATMDEHLWSIAVARIVLGGGIHLQAPPNLAYDDFPLLLDAGIDDWGGVSPLTVDHVNPEAPWPEVQLLREACRSRGLELAPRLPLYPEHVADLDRWADSAVAPAILRAADAHGLPREHPWPPGEPVSLPPVARRDPAFDHQLRTYLFSDGPILRIEALAEADQSDGGGDTASGASDDGLGIGSLRDIG